MAKKKKEKTPAYQWISVEPPVPEKKTIQFNKLRMTLRSPVDYTYGPSVVFEEYKEDRGWFTVEADDGRLILDFVIPMLVAPPAGPRHAAVSFMQSVFFGLKNKFTCKVLTVRKWWKLWKAEYVVEFSHQDGTDYIGGERWLTIRSDRDSQSLFEVQKFILSCLADKRAYELLSLCFESAGIQNSVEWHND